VRRGPTPLLYAGSLRAIRLVRKAAEPLLPSRLRYAFDQVINRLIRRFWRAPDINRVGTVQPEVALVGRYLGCLVVNLLVCRAHSTA